MSEDIHSLLGKYFSGLATEEEATSVINWRRAGNDNEKEFRLLEELWNKSGNQPFMSFDTEKAWQAIDKKIRKVSSKGRVMAMPVKKMMMAAAACLLVVVAVWWMINWRENDHTILADTDIKEVSLPDNSKVYLRKGSSITYPTTFEKDSRQVRLQGEAFFEVTPDKTKPFSITAAATEVKVVGTSFSVNTGGDKVELIVRTGIVKFGSLADTSRVTVIAGEKAVFSNGSVSKKINTDPNFNAWQTGKLVFNNRPLKEILDEFGSYYKVNFVLERSNKEQLENTLVTASFDNESLAAAIDELAMITTFNIRRLNNNNYEVSIK